jgi:hypothetical protein
VQFHKRTEEGMTVCPKILIELQLITYSTYTNMPCELLRFMRKDMGLEKHRSREGLHPAGPRKIFRLLDVTA